MLVGYDKTFDIEMRKKSTNYLKKILFFNK